MHLNLKGARALLAAVAVISLAGAASANPLGQPYTLEWGNIGGDLNTDGAVDSATGIPLLYDTLTGAPLNNFFTAGPRVFDGNPELSFAAGSACAPGIR